MNKIRLGFYWCIDGHHMEVTKMFKNGKCQITEKWVAEDTYKDCKHVENYGIGTDGNEQYVYALDYPEYKLYASGAFNWTPEMEEEEEKEMAKEAQVQVIEIEVEGIKYTQTRPGYYYKRVDGKNTRISKAEWEQAFDAYTAQVNEVDEQWDAKDEIQSRKDLQDTKDRETEDNFNGKKAKKTRRSKDVAFATILNVDGEEKHITLTAKQADFIRHLPDTSFWEQGLDSCPWCDVLAEEIGGQFAGKPMTVGAMISTLREKDLLTVGRDTSRQGKPKFMQLTDLGKAVAKELGLN